MAYVRSKANPVSKKFRGGFTDWTGKQQSFTGTRDKEETLLMAHKLEDENTKKRLLIKTSGLLYESENFESLDDDRNFGDQISERTCAAMQHMKNTGKRVGTIPFGFDCLDGENLKPNAREQATIDVIKDFRKKGYTLASIASELGIIGLKTKKGNSKWSRKVIASILNGKTSQKENVRILSAKNSRLYKYLQTIDATEDFREEAKEYAFSKFYG